MTFELNDKVALVTGVHLTQRYLLFPQCRNFVGLIAKPRLGPSNMEISSRSRCRHGHRWEASKHR